MGGDAEPKAVNQLAQYIHTEHPQFHVAWYSGRIRIPAVVNIPDFDYIKIGPFIRHLGPLKERTTNQRLYHILPNGDQQDITERFWRK
jgi:anaerobic ribonucleoside-triphosphate reductase activating protein